MFESLFPPPEAGERTWFRTLADGETVLFRFRQQVAGRGGWRARPRTGHETLDGRRHPRAGVLIVGAAGSGKDTLVRFIQEDFGTHPIGFADPLRLFLRVLLGPGKHRAAAQAIGDAVRAVDPDAFVRLARRRATRSRRYVMTDVRLPQEFAAFPDSLSIGLSASPAVRAARLARRDGSAYQPLQHVTESEVDRLLPRCDVVLTNEGDSLEAFYARYVAEVRPRLAAYFATGRPTAG